MVKCVYKKRLSLSLPECSDRMLLQASSEAVEQTPIQQLELDIHNREMELKDLKQRLKDLKMDADTIIHLLRPSGESVSMQVKPKMTISAVKRAIVEQFDFAPSYETLELVFNIVRLGNGRTVNGARIRDRDLVNIVFRNQNVYTMYEQTPVQNEPRNNSGALVQNKADDIPEGGAVASD